MLYDVPWPWQGACRALQAWGVWLTLRSAGVIDPLELAGIRQVLGRVRPPAFRVFGPYRLVRHPIYFGWALMTFGTPLMTGTRLSFAVISTAYLMLAIPFEERALIEVFGEEVQDLPAEGAVEDDSGDLLTVRNSEFGISSEFGVRNSELLGMQESWRTEREMHGMLALEPLQQPEPTPFGLCEPPQPAASLSPSGCKPNAAGRPIVANRRQRRTAWRPAGAFLQSFRIPALLHSEVRPNSERRIPS